MDEYNIDKLNKKISDAKEISHAILTGATGMIGCALCRELLERGVEVVALVRPASPKIKNLPEDKRLHLIPLELRELKDFSRVAGLIRDTWQKKSKESLVWFHLGWAGTFGRDVRNDFYLQNENIQYTLDAVNVAKELKCDIFVGAGSQAEYGRAQRKQGENTPLSADTPTFPENGYGIAKLAAGQMSRILCRKFEIRHEWVRILSIYGPGDTEGTMVMSAIRSFLDGKQTAFSPGEQIWDYLYVDDAARALYLVAKNGVDGAIYPLGSGMARPLKDYIEKIRSATGSREEIGLGKLPYAPNPIMYLRADISELRKDTGFEPQISFEEGIRRTVKWVKRNE